MRIIRNLDNFPSELQQSVLVIGNFDSVHMAHQSLIEAAKYIAKKDNKKLLIMSFTPHPRYYFQPDSPKIEIEPIKTRLSRLRKTGVDAIILMRFNAKLANLTAEQFITDILQAKLRTSHIVIGEDFRFGKDRGGSPTTLRKYGITCTAFPPIKMAGEIISSSKIRQYLSDGDMESTAKMLGRNYIISGIVRKGAAIGREIGAPTANISLQHLYKPRFGVYICSLIIDQIKYEAIANIGVRPTIYENSEAMLEVHSLMPVPNNLYGKKINVELLHFMRDEQKFDNIKALQQHIKHDIAQAQEYFLLKNGRIA
jgi:riboflavin kinase / FMN adenylyltransferase